MVQPSYRPYKGKIINQNLWHGNSEVRDVLMQPGLAGSYTWIATESARSKQFLYHGHFHRAIIENDSISFWGAKGDLLLSIHFDKGEVKRILNNDNWFKSESWFKVDILQLQLTLF